MHESSIPAKRQPLNILQIKFEWEEYNTHQNRIVSKELRLMIEKTITMQMQRDLAKKSKK